MSTASISTNPPALSTTATIPPSLSSTSHGEDIIKSQLELEEKLQSVGGELLDLYKRNGQWIQVGQLAQTLNSNSERIASLVSSLDDSVFTMEEGPYNITVINEPSNCWVIKLSNTHLPVSRSLEDINYLKLHLSNKYHTLSTLSALPLEQRGEPSCSDLQLLLTTALNDDIIKQDDVLACFVSSKIDKFSLVQKHQSKQDTAITTNGTSPKPTNTTTSDNKENVTITSQALTNEATNTITNDNSKDQNGTTISQIKDEDTKANNSSSSMSIGEYDSSPHIPKRQPSTTPPISPLLDTQFSKRESSSDEVCGSEDRTSESDNTTTASMPNGGARPVFQKGRSHTAFPQSTKSSSSSSKKKSKSFKKKSSVIEEDIPVVTLASPQSTIDWDPTCLLEELYNDCQPGAGHSQTGENSRYVGYLDKLPVNQRKSAVMKGWKHRYFRLTRGSLFYYDAENSTKATSFIRLSDSKIVQHPKLLQLEIIEKGGNFIMLRAESLEELQKWCRFIQLEAVHPTMTHRLSLSPGRSEAVIIIDLGACSVRAGIVNDNTYPQVFFPTVCACSDDKIVACGNEALLPDTRTNAKLIYPCRRRIRLDSSLPIRECFQCIIESICKMLKIEPQNCSALICISPVMPETEQVTLCEVLLEILNFKSILLQEQTTMALYSYNHTSGIVVNIGDSTDVVPIIDGFKVDAGTSHFPFGGHSITESLSKLATSHGIRYFSESEMYIVRFIKESICFLSQDYPSDCEKCEETPSEYKRAVDVDRFQLSDHKKVIHLDSALFTSTEGLFTPGVWGKDTIGLHEMVQKAIEQCPIDMRRQMVRHIYLAGGTTLLVGLQERLQKELELMYPRLEIQVHGSENRHHASFLGAGVLASLNSFSKSLVDLESWTAKGLEAMTQSEI